MTSSFRRSAVLAFSPLASYRVPLARGFLLALTLSACTSESVESAEGATSVSPTNGTPIPVTGTAMTSGGGAGSSPEIEPSSGNAGGTSSDPVSSGGTSPSAEATGGASLGDPVGGMGSAGEASAGATADDESNGGAASGGAPSGGAASGGEVSGGAGSGGSSSADAGSGGAGGAASDPPDFQPCPADAPCKVLPLGDSITFGALHSSGGGGYRIELFRLALADGHDITFTGNETNGPMMVDGVAFPRQHEGHGGWTDEQINGLIPSPALDEMPHIILIHAGTNDMYGSDPPGAGDRFATLLDDVVAAAPDALIVVGSIVPIDPDPNGQFGGRGAENVAPYNAEVESHAMAAIEAGAHVVFVDHYTDFPLDELGDGVHPNDAGYARMGARWYEGIEGYLR